MMRWSLTGILLFLATHFSLAQHWAWVDHLTGGGGSHYAIDCAIGNDPNEIYFCGRYRATATFYGQDGSNVVNPPFGGARDLFLAKTDSAGHFIWVKTIGGSDTEYGFSVTVDEFDNVYITGQFYTGCNFEGIPITSVGSGDMYVAKFDTDGNFIWVKTWGGTGLDTGTKIVCDKAGSVYVGGSQGGNFYYNSDSLQWPGYFVMKLDYAGNTIWAKGPQNLTAALSNLYGLKLYDNELYFGGKYNGTIKLDAITLVSNGGWSDVLFAKMDTSGLVQWAYDAGSTTYDVCNDIAVTDSFIYVAGAYSGTVSFDTITKTCNQSVAGSTGALNSRDGFIAKYDSTGACYWVIEHKSLMAEDENSLIIDKNGDLVVAGGYLQSPDPTVAGSVGELRLTAYTQDADSLWSITAVGAMTGLAHGICSDEFGNVYFSGAVKDVHTFESYSIPASSAVYSGIMAKILPPINPVFSQTPQSCVTDTVSYFVETTGATIFYDWYFGTQTLITDGGDSLVLLFDPSITDSVSCVITNGIEQDTVVFATPVFNFPQTELGPDVSTCDTEYLLQAGTDGEFYDWGTGSVLYDSTLLVTADGMYYVTVVNADQCAVTDSVFVDFKDCTGIIEAEEEVKYRVDPQAIYIFTDKVDYAVTIYGLDGRAVLFTPHQSSGSVIPVSGLAPGIYILVLTGQNGQPIAAGKFYH
jgi:hypothetical protein